MNTFMKIIEHAFFVIVAILIVLIHLVLAPICIVWAIVVYHYRWYYDVVASTYKNIEKKL